MYVYVYIGLNSDMMKILDSSAFHTKYIYYIQRFEFKGQVHRDENKFMKFEITNYEILEIYQCCTQYKLFEKWVLDPVGVGRCNTSL